MALALAPNWYKSQAIAEQQGAGLTGTALSLHMLRIWAMATPGRVLDQVWLTILAGGEGQRMRSFVERWLGHHRPKQYCAFVGTRSMFQHTVDRALQLIRPEHIIAVVAQHHREDVQDQLTDRHIGTVIHQPDNRETAAGIFLALTYVHAEDPNRTVVIFPSDHFIYPEACFLDLVRQAIAVTEALPDRLVLLGAEPDRLELDYGWMVPGALLPVSGSQTRVRGLTAFLEKPSPREADEALRSGALWNTFVMAAKADTLWKLGWVCFPDVMSRFERLKQAIGSPEECRVLNIIYETMPVKNFSSDLLQRVPEVVAVMEMTGVLWCDWGKPQRVSETLRRISRAPAFSLNCLDRPFAPIAQGHSITAGANV